MHSVAWLSAGILLTCALVYAYRLLRGTLAHTMFLAFATGAAMIAGYLLN